MSKLGLTLKKNSSDPKKIISLHPENKFPWKYCKFSEAQEAAENLTKYLAAPYNLGHTPKISLKLKKSGWIKKIPSSQNFTWIYIKNPVRVRKINNKITDNKNLMLGPGNVATFRKISRKYKSFRFRVLKIRAKIEMNQAGFWKISPDFLKSLWTLTISDFS